LQEVKAFEHQIPNELRFVIDQEKYGYVWHAGERPGYAGTAIFYKKDKFDSVSTKNEFDGLSHFHEDGRVVEIEASYKGMHFVLLNLYFPNGGTRANGQEMLTYKKEFYDYFLNYINEKKKK